MDEIMERYRAACESDRLAHEAELAAPFDKYGKRPKDVKDAADLTFRAALAASVAVYRAGRVKS